jgi:hypothetical protein
VSRRTPAAEPNVMSMPFAASAAFWSPSVWLSFF